jgi:hypothetical protein
MWVISAPFRTKSLYDGSSYLPSFPLLIEVQHIAEICSQISSFKSEPVEEVDHKCSPWELHSNEEVCGLFRPFWGTFWQDWSNRETKDWCFSDNIQVTRSSFEGIIINTTTIISLLWLYVDKMASLLHSVVIYIMCFNKHILYIIIYVNSNIQMH